MAAHELEGELRSIRERLARLERIVGVAEAGAALRGRVDESALTGAAPEPDETSGQESGAAERAARLKKIQESVRRGASPAGASAGESPAAAGAALSRGDESKPPAGDDAWELEQFIGLRAFAALGALVIVVGAALFLKLAWDRGWLQMISPTWRCVWSASFGMALLIAGEAAQRRVNAWAAAGLHAAGIGVLYATAYAAHGFFDLVSAPTGFGLVAAASVIGVGVAARSRLALVAAVSLLGGYITPLLFQTAEPPPPYFLPVYWIALLIGGLALAHAFGQWFHGIRWLVWSGTVLFGGAWTLGEGVNHPAVALGFLAGAAALCQGELALGVWRRAGAGQDEDGASAALREVEALQLLASAAMTTFVVVLGFIVVRASANPGLDWMPAAAAAGGLLLGAAALGGDVRRLPQEASTPLDRLSTLFMAKAGALVASAVSLALTEWMESLALLSLGAGAAAVGHRLRARGLAWYGLIVLAVGTARVTFIDVTLANVVDVGEMLGGLWLSRWTALMIGAATIWLTVGALALRLDARRWRRWAIGAAIVAWALAMASILNQRSEAASVMAAWLAASAALGAAARLGGAIPCRGLALAGTALAMGPWMIAYEPWDWADYQGAVGAHPGLWTSIMIAAVGGAVSLSLLRRVGSDDARNLGAAGVGLSLLLVFATTSLESARGAERLLDDQTAQRAVVSIWWGLFALPLLAIGFWRSVTPLRYTALALLGAATFKAITFDMTMVAAEWRIATLIGLGLLLLGVALVYARRVLGEGARGALQDDDTGPTPRSD